MAFQIFTNLLQTFQKLLKKAMSKWTCIAQTPIVQGSIVLLLLKHILTENQQRNQEVYRLLSNMYLCGIVIEFKN